MSKRLKFVAYLVALTILALGCAPSENQQLGDIGLVLPSHPGDDNWAGEVVVDRPPGTWAFVNLDSDKSEPVLTASWDAEVPLKDGQPDLRRSFGPLVQPLPVMVCDAELWFSLHLSIKRGTSSLRVGTFLAQASGELGSFEVAIDAHDLTVEQTVAAVAETFTASTGPEGRPLLDCDPAVVAEKLLDHEATSGTVTKKLRDFEFEVYNDILNNRFGT